MARDTVLRRLLASLAYLAMAGVLISLRLMPQRPEPGGLPWPDLLFCLTSAWVLRRPEQLPAPVIALAFLAADLLTQAPPGLKAALVVGAMEILRARALNGRPQSLAADWIRVAFLALAVAGAGWAVLGVTMAPRPELALIMAEAAMTAAAYPVLVIVLGLAGLGRRAFGKPAGAGER